MGCQVMGGDSSKCTESSEDNAALLKATDEPLFQRAVVFKEYGPLCDFYKCSDGCLYEVGCDNYHTQASCEKNETNVSEAAAAYGVSCHIDCASTGQDTSGAKPIAILGITALLLAAMMQL